MPKISDSKVLILATDGFEESELFGPLELLRKRGASVALASPGLEPIQATVSDEPGKTISPDLRIEEARSQDYDALILPGGVRNPDSLRTDEKAVRLVREFAAAGKPVAAICHGPWLLIEADVVRGRTVTGWASIRTDLRNAGANVVDRPVAVDDNIITSRKPEDVEPFTKAVIDSLESTAAQCVADSAPA